MNVEIDIKKTGLALLATLSDLSRWYLRGAATSFGIITVLHATGVVVLY
tara:strand:- start:288 stop:434 length:147 start_codon:yes stop_codon:yes gene_type:complete